jgi:hypothetical protein
MKLFEVYEDMMFAEAWNKLEEILQSGLFQEEGDSKLNQLLEIANLFIFEAFGISPDQEGKYFISGSARLFKHPRLLNVLHDHDPNFELTIGDLDVVVPGEKEWKTLYNNYTNKDSKFIKKLRKKIGKSPEEIKNVFLKQESNWKKGIYRPGNGDGGLRDAVNVGGHYYMNIYDVFDYKSKLNRDKEKKIVEFLKQYLSSDETPENAEKLFRQIGEVVGKKK